MKCYRSEFKQAQVAILGCMLALGATTFASTIEVDADGGETLVVNNTAESAQNLKVGTDNGDNSLIITNAGSMVIDVATVGSVGGFGNNSVLVTGSNSYLQARETMDIGTASGSTGNQFSVEDNAWVYVGDENTSPFASGISVGSTNSGATLAIGSGSQVVAANLLVGTQSNTTGTVTLTGQDSDTTLALSENLHLGTGSSDNSITLDSGASLTVGQDLIIGSTNTTDNYLTINNGSSVVIEGTTTINSPTNNAIVVNSGGHLGISEGLNLDAEDDGYDIKAGASLELGGNLEADKLDQNIAVTIKNAGTTWFTTNDHVYVGDTVDGNKLTVKDGASVLALSGKKLYVGNDSDSNELTITGSNSTLVAQGESFIGSKGSGNVLTIENNGYALMSGALKIGNASTANGNVVNVNSNGTLIAADNLIIGVKGSSNELNMDGGTLEAQKNLVLGYEGANNRYNQTGGTNTVTEAFIIGSKEEASGATGHVDDDAVETTGNLAMIGTNATLSIGQDLTVGKEGGGSILAVRDGGIVNVAGDAVIGEAVGDNYIYLQRDSNTQFNVAGDLVIGKEGGSNRFAAYGGTAMVDGNVYLGATTNQHDIKNFIHLETSNAVLIANSVHIGASNSLNTLDLADGAKLLTTDLFVGAYEGVSNNTVTVDGENSTVTLSGQLVIGSATGSNNTLTVQNGGTLDIAQENISIGSTNDSLTVADGGILKTLGWDFAAQTNLATNIVFASGSTLHMQGALAGTNTIEGGLNFVLDGPGASWDSNTNLYVGYNTANNSLTLTNGAFASTSTNLYIGYATESNQVAVGGTGTSLSVGSDLYIGTEETASKFNSLSVHDGATVSVMKDAYLFRGAELKIDSKSQVDVTGDYKQDQYSTLTVGVSSNQVSPNMIVGGTAEFASSNDPENNPVIRVINEGVGESNSIAIVQAESITVDGANATGEKFDGNIEGDLLTSFKIIITNNLNLSYIVLTDFQTESLGDGLGLEGQLLDISEEITALSEAGNSNATETINLIKGMDSEESAAVALDNLYGEKMSSVPANNIINMGIQSVSEQLTMRADNTRNRSGSSSAPAGAAGPHAVEQELQGWISGFGTWGDQDAASGFDGYEADISGFMVGADLSVAENVLVGLAGGSSSATIDQNAGSSTDTKTAYAAIYASMGTEDWFGDISLIYANSSIDSRLDPNFDTTAEYDANNFAFMLGGGKEYIGKYLILTPYASFLGNFYSQESYKEKSSVMGREVDSFSNFNLQSSFGGSAAMYLGMGEVTFKPEVRLSWLHEWLGDDEKLDYQLIGGTGSYTMQLQAPEKDIIKLGIGSSAKFGEYLELRADLDTRFGKNYSDYTLLGSLRYQF